MVGFDIGGPLAIFIIIANFSWAATFSRNCPVFEAPYYHAKIICRFEKGTLVKTGSVHGLFVGVRNDRCEGFTVDKCILFEREPAAIPSRTSFGIMGSLAGLWAIVPNSVQSSKGYDWGFGAVVAMSWSALRAKLGLSYELLSLTRIVATVGALSDPGIEAVQNGKYLGLELMAQLPWEAGWTVDLDIQYLKSLSVTQRMLAIETAVAGSGNLVIVALGSSWQMPEHSLELSLSVRYNLATNATHHLYSLRFMGAYYL